MTVKPHIKTMNWDAHGTVRSMTIGFVNSPVMVHFRMNHRGITYYKISPKQKMDSVNSPYTSSFEKAALRLVFEETGKTVWLRPENKKVVDTMPLNAAVRELTLHIP